MTVITKEYIVNNASHLSNQSAKLFDFFLFLRTALSSRKIVYNQSLYFFGSVVRHKDVGIEGVKDKFRIQVTEHGQKTVIGIIFFTITNDTFKSEYDVRGSEKRLGYSQVANGISE